ncbi:malto-oligosyltrehalose trehalohydrolase [Nostocoides japonicum]|nr:malto-oligosyltrehalose trehalohydrolase [Tetrasphaera japonica]
MIRVWAPRAGTMEIEVGPVGEARRRYPMVSESGGWWSWPGAPGVRPDTSDLDYAFVLDGTGPPLPDPRSAYQPEGVHGPSRWFADPGRVVGAGEADPPWRGPQGGTGVLGGVFYELHLGTFTEAGTLDAAIGRIPVLRDLGIDVVELMPVAAFPGRWNWGYDGVGLWAVDDSYASTGTGSIEMPDGREVPGGAEAPDGPDALRRFVDACHRHGIGVCLDVVYNHLGPSGNYLSRFGPYFTEEHTTPWGPAVNFDAAGSVEVRRFVIEAALRWFREFGVDALRLDAVHELRDDSGRHILAELSDEVAALAARLGRPLDLVAESDLNDTRMVTSTAQGGLGMTAQWDDDVHHALHVALTGETSGYYADFADPGALAKVLTKGFHHDGTYSSFRGRDWGRPVEVDGFDGRRLLAYLQTHDQVGNRALGDRITASVTPGQQAIGAALYLTSAYTPLVFMGEEWGASTPFQFFTDFEEPELAAAVSAGRREEFASHGWRSEDIPDPQDPRTRARSVLRWEERHEPAHARMWRWYAALIDLRHREPDLSSGDLAGVRVHHDAAGWLVMRRGAFATVVNLADRPAEAPLPPEATASDVVLSWSGSASVAEGRLSLEGHDAAVVRLRS